MQAASSAAEVERQLEADFQFCLLPLDSAPERLTRLGVSAEFLRLARGGRSGLGRHFLDWAGEMLGREFPTGRSSARVVDALLALEHERKFSLSPWSGTFVATRHSLGANWYLFDDESGAFLIGQLSQVTVPAHDTIWILPGARKILYVDAGFSQAELRRMAAAAIFELAQRSRALKVYLRRKTREVLIADWPCEHFGHYVWNVLSAWGALFESAPAGRIRSIAAKDTGRYFGPIRELFALGQPVEERPQEDPAQLCDRVFEQSLLLISIRAHFISEWTARRAIAHSLARCDRDFLGRLEALAAAGRPLVLFSLRLENRAWVDQLEGFEELARRIKQDFPGAAFLIHGLSANTAMGSTTAWMSLDEEKRLAEALTERLVPIGGVLNAVGLSIHESLTIAEACDIFVAPAGSGMALYKWLANKPGVAFSNRFCSDPANPGRWPFTIFDGHRPGMIPACYVPLAAITDVEAGRHGLASRANFTLDRAVLNEQVRALLGSLPESGRWRNPE